MKWNTAINITMVALGIALVSFCVSAFVFVATIVF